MPRFVADDRGFRAARGRGGAAYAAYLVVLFARATTFLQFFVVARRARTRVVDCAALCCLGISSMCLHFVQNVWCRLPGDVFRRPQPWCARYASAADSAAIAGIAAAVASGDGFTFAITALVVFAWDLVVVRPDDIWPRRYVRAAAFAVVAAVTLARLPPETRAAHGAAAAATAALFPCVIKSRPNLVVNTAFACAWHAATARGALYALGLRE